MKVQGGTDNVLGTDRSSRLLPGRPETDLEEQA